MAIGWVLETGIYSKMASDVGQNQNWTIEWTRPSNRELESLKLSHVLLLIYMFGAMIMLSMFVFGLEVLSKGGKRVKEFPARIQRVLDAGYPKHVQCVHVANGIPEIV